MDFSPRCKPHASLAKYYEVVLLISTFVVKPGRERAPEYQKSWWEKKPKRSIEE